MSCGSTKSTSDSNDLNICWKHFEEVVIIFTFHLLWINRYLHILPHFHLYFLQKMADNCTWDDKTTTAFINVMLENIDELTSSNFKLHMFNKFADEIYNRTTVIYTSAQLSQKFNRLRIEWRKYNWLLKQTGLGIHPTTGAIDATDDQWQTLERVNRFFDCLDTFIHFNA